MYYGDDHQHEPRVWAGWVFLGLIALIAIFGLGWLHEQTKPRELFWPSYEQSVTPQHGDDTIS